MVELDEDGFPLHQWGQRVICTKCGNKERFRCKHGCSLKSMVCTGCGSTGTFKRWYDYQLKPES